MNRNYKFIVSLLLLSVVLIAVAGCSEGERVGELQTKSETIELGSADSANVEINMGAGELEVSGGAADLLEATFTYNVSELNPSATFIGGNLLIEEEDVKGGLGTLLDLHEFRNEWDLRFSDDVPLEMNIQLGAGRTNLSLGSLALASLDVDAGAGDVDLDLSGSQALTQFDFQMGAGDITVDLTGDWQDDLDATVQGGLGEMTLRLPSEVGVRLEVNTGIGSVDTSGLSKNGNIYTNDAYDNSDVVLRLEIDGGVGQINLEVQ